MITLRGLMVGLLVLGVVTFLIVVGRRLEGEGKSTFKLFSPSLVSELRTGERVLGLILVAAILAIGWFAVRLGWVH